MALDFVTTTHNDYKFPVSRPVIGKPCAPPSPRTVPEPPRPPVPPYCHCDLHSYEPQLEQYKELLEKEREVCEDYAQLRGQIAHVVNEIMSNPCDSDDVKMESIYQITYRKRGFPIVPYRTIMAGVESPHPPVEVHRIGQLAAYKDPTSFDNVHQPVVRPIVEPASESHTAVKPQSVIAWFADYPGRTEYMDNYSKAAKANWAAMQRYREPLPSARRRADDKCV